jgi:hypothetical protein
LWRGISGNKKTHSASLMQSGKWFALDVAGFSSLGEDGSSGEDTDASRAMGAGSWMYRMPAKDSSS